MQKKRWIVDEKDLGPADPDVSLVTPEYGRSQTVSHIISNDCAFMMADSQFRTSVKWISAMDCNRSAMVIRVNLKASSSAPETMRFLSTGDDIEQHTDAYCLGMLPEARAEMLFPSGCTSHMVSLLLTPAMLQEMLNGCPVPQRIRDFVDGRDYGCLNAKLPPALRRAAIEIVDCPYIGAVRELYFRSKAYEFLMEVILDQDYTSPRQDRMFDGERRRALEARDILRAEIASPSSIEDIAHRLDTTPRKLNRAFRDTYGKSVFEYLVDLRLELACELLRETAFPLKTVAAKLGYRYSDNFIHAFTKRFGKSPNKFRRDC